MSKYVTFCVNVMILLIKTFSQYLYFTSSLVLCLIKIQQYWYAVVGKIVELFLCSCCCFLLFIFLGLNKDGVYLKISTDILFCCSSYRQISTKPHCTLWSPCRLVNRKSLSGVTRCHSFSKFCHIKVTTNIC